MADVRKQAVGWLATLVGPRRLGFQFGDPAFQSFDVLIEVVGLIPVASTVPPGSALAVPYAEPAGEALPARLERAASLT